MSKSSQESSPITQWRKTVQEALQGKHWRDPEAAITSATIELIEGLIPQEDTRLFPGWPLGDPVRETCYKQGRNEAITELRQSLKEMNHDIER